MNTTVSETQTQDVQRLHGARVRGEDFTGTIVVEQGAAGPAPYVQTSDGKKFPFALHQLTVNKNEYVLPVSRTRLEHPAATIPVLAEELVIEKRAVATGAVRVEKKVTERTETVDIPIVREYVDIRRVVVDQVISEMPKPREEGDTLVIPVVEEQLVVTKRLVLKEEVHLVRRRAAERHTEQVTLLSEHAEIARVDVGGQRIEDKKSRAAAPPPPPRVPRKTF